MKYGPVLNVLNVDMDVVLNADDVDDDAALVEAVLVVVGIAVVLVVVVAGTVGVVAVVAAVDALIVVAGVVVVMSVVVLCTVVVLVAVAMELKVVKASDKPTQPKLKLTVVLGGNVTGCCWLFWLGTCNTTT